MNRTRVVVLGLGAIALEHLKRLQARDDVEVVAVCDLSPTLARAVADRFGGLPVHTDAGVALAATAPDAVHVLTPPASHLELVTLALDAGAHVLVEKPAAPTWEAWAAMRDRSRERGLMLVENHNYRFTPAVERALALVGGGPLGEVVHVDVAFRGVMGAAYADPFAPHFAHALPGGALQNFVSHPLSLALAAIGDVLDVHAVRRRRDPGFASDDELRVLLAGPSATAAVDVSRHGRPAGFTLDLHATGGRASVDVYADHLEVVTGEAGVATAARRGAGGFGQAAQQLGRMATGRRDTLAGLTVLIDRFYAGVRGGPVPLGLDELDRVNRVVCSSLGLPAEEVPACA